MRTMLIAGSGVAAGVLATGAVWHGVAADHAAEQVEVNAADRIVYDRTDEMWQALTTGEQQDLCSNPEPARRVFYDDVAEGFPEQRGLVRSVLLTNCEVSQMQAE